MNGVWKENEVRNKKVEREKEREVRGRLELVSHWETLGFSNCLDNLFFLAFSVE